MVSLCSGSSKLTSLSLIRGSHHTTSSLSAPEQLAVVSRALCAPQGLQLHCHWFFTSVSMAGFCDKYRDAFMKVFGNTEGAGACMAAKLQTFFRQMWSQKCLDGNQPSWYWWFPYSSHHSTLFPVLVFCWNLPELENSFYAKGWCSWLRGICRVAMRKLWVW